jgi:Uma2 family endonuclease
MSSAVAEPVSQTTSSPSASRVKNYFVWGDNVRIPGWVIDFDSFREWTLSDVFPSDGRIDYINDEIWADMNMEELLTHNQVKLEIGAVLATLVRQQNLGMLIADRMRLIHRLAKLSCEPDLTFASWETLKTSRLAQVANADGQVMLLDGTPDMVMEVVSVSSIQKDTVELMAQYAAAQISEYWLVDVRKSAQRFQILALQNQVFVASDTANEWQHSAVFQKTFRLVRSTNPLGKPQFTLEYR